MKKSQRYWEIDVVRAIALLLMLVQHTLIVWNLLAAKVAKAPEWAEDIGRIGAILFLLLVGVSGYILFSKKNKVLTSQEIDSLFLKRGLFLLGLGIVVSLATFFVIPKSPIYFGVLSFIGLSIIFLPFLIKNAWLRWLTLFTAPVLGYLLSFVHPDTLAWLPVGIYPVPFYSSDYWPFFPWISLILAGVIIGQHLYTDGHRQIALPDKRSVLVAVLQYIGSHTLLLYMVHLPFLYVLLLGIQYLLKL